MLSGGECQRNLCSHRRPYEPQHLPLASVSSTAGFDFPAPESDPSSPLRALGSSSRFRHRGPDVLLVCLRPRAAHLEYARAPAAPRHLPPLSDIVPFRGPSFSASTALTTRHKGPFMRPEVPANRYGTYLQQRSSPRKGLVGETPSPERLYRHSYATANADTNNRTQTMAVARISGIPGCAVAEDGAGDRGPSVAGGIERLVARARVCTPSRFRRPVRVRYGNRPSRSRSESWSPH
ncbi:hypothetical protein C8Q80DRAFT_835410 [Daedaleopsis nitida]|nr:hypothetical protein C8Q80DRAFT_835410 [Daedaleopsis nitida]